MKSKEIYLFALLALIACSGNRGIDAEIAIYDEETDLFIFNFEAGIAGEAKLATLNEIVDSIYYIPLETHRNALLSDLYEFEKIGSHMFIRATGTATSVWSPIYQFDSLGRFVSQVTYHGRGPNEILTLMEWYANPNLAQINVVSSSSYMVVTSMDRGDRFSIGIEGRWGYYIVPLNDSTFVSAQNLFDAGISETHLYFIDRRGDLIHTIVIERDIEFVNYEYETSEYYWVPPYERCWLVSEYSGDAIFHDMFNDTLYRIKNYREISPHLVFTRGDLSPRPADTQKPENKKNQVYFTSVMDSGSYVFLNYYYGGKIWCDVWAKHDGGLVIHAEKERPSLLSDIFLPFSLPDGGVIELQVVYADKDNIYCVMEALDACKFLPGVKEDDNPVIVVAKLKK